MTPSTIVSVLIAVAAFGAAKLPAQRIDAGTWPAYGRDPGGSRFSPLKQIDTSNVHGLEVAWVYRTGDLLADRSRFEATPILVDGILYVSTPLGRVSALDPATGDERWTYDPGVRLDGDYGDFANRGVSTWLDSAAAPSAPCRRRIFVAPVDARLIALDARTGRVCERFGSGGTVDLTAGLRTPPRYKGEYQVTSPPVAVGAVVVVGSSVADNQRVDAPSGEVRAYDARTGALRWRWHPIPESPSDSARATWRAPGGKTAGAANAWSVMSADPARDLVFIPVGSASPDFYGGERLGDNRYANSVVALRASTGAFVWHFQVVHHDLWDYDVPAQPVLFTLRRDGREIPALAQATKMGHLFILNRETGRPLFPVEERRVPPSDVEGEVASATQPFPVRPSPLAPQRLTADSAFGLTDAERTACSARIAALRNEGIFTPPSLGGTLIYPGNIGGSHWGAVAVDDARGIIVVPTNRLAFAVTLVPRANVAGLPRGRPFSEFAPQRDTPYAMVRDVLFSPQGVPCTPPPWGTLTAIDASTGERLWEVPLGYIPAVAQAVPAGRDWGSINLGGPMVTAGGLAFMAGTFDGHLRAFDLTTGRERWRGKLPTAAHATPMTYEAGGRQFVVAVAGGHDRVGTQLGDYVVAFALPRRTEARRIPPPIAGMYEGDLRVGDNRFPTTLTLTVNGANADSVSGIMRSTDPLIEGTLAGRAAGDTLTFTIDFRIPSRSCAGQMRGAADIANGGQLLVSRVRVSGPCTTGGEEAGTFGLRRR